jgi:hypothetical protein
MKRKFYLMLISLLMAGGISAQITIGSGIEPVKGAILDLKSQDADDDNVTSTTGGLLLPRVQLVNTGSVALFFDGTEPSSDVKRLLTGLMVYNLTNDEEPDGLRPGPYNWDGEKWVTFTDADSIIGNEVLNATDNDGLRRAGSGTTADPYTLGIADGGVTDVKLNNMGANNNNVLAWSDSENKWVPKNLSGLLPPPSGGSIMTFTLNATGNTITGNSALTPGIWLLTGVLSYTQNVDASASCTMDTFDGTMTWYTRIDNGGSKPEHVLLFGSANVNRDSPQVWTGVINQPASAMNLLVTAVKLAD